MREGVVCVGVKREDVSDESSQRSEGGMGGEVGEGGRRYIINNDALRKLFIQ